MRTTKDLLSDQTLIFYLIKSKLDAVNFIKQGYENDEPVLCNPFLINVALNYHRSLYIDFAALFGKGDDHRNNFHMLYDKRFNYRNEIPENVLEKVMVVLNKYKPSKEPIKRILKYRNKEIAHYDPIVDTVDGKTLEQSERVSVSFNWNDTDLFNELNDVGTNLIKMVGSELGVDFRFNYNSRVKSLKKLMEQVNTKR